MEQEILRSETISGEVQHVIFHNDENGYTILELGRAADLVTVTGTMPPLFPGDFIEAQGKYIEHYKYGRQFQAELVVKQAPRDVTAIFTYLSSGVIRGLGPRTAERLVAAFGEATLEVLRAEPERVAKLRGISLAKANTFAKALAEEGALRELSLLLLPFGIGSARVLAIYKVLGVDAERVIRANPYWLAQHVRGIGFETAEKLAEAFGIAGDSPVRVQGALIYYLARKMTQEGHTLFAAKQIIAELAGVLAVEQELVAAEIIKLQEKGSLTVCAFASGSLVSVFDTGQLLEHAADWGVTFAAVYLAESRLAAMLLAKSRGSTSPLFGDDYNSEYVTKKIIATAELLDFSPGKDQLAAIQMALNAKISILTGGPGTGKTTTVKVLTQILTEAGLTLSLCAPTGRAARRLGMVCGREASTIHHLLEIKAGENLLDDLADMEEQVTIEADYVIVDECSMIDMALFYRLFSAVRADTRVLLIGDADQLPSIGAGQVLRDLIAAQRIPTTQLCEVYRQEEHRLIVQNAHRVIRGEKLLRDQTLASDFLLILRENEEEMSRVVVSLCGRVLRESYGIDGVYGAQVVSPVKRGAAGVQRLNNLLQGLVQGEDGVYLEAYGNRFAVNDKVMQMQNDYNLEYFDMLRGKHDRGVMNGELGVVREIDLATGTVTVLFEEERLVTLAKADLENLGLAYATTIHKTQGSEYPVVVLVLPAGAPSFLTRNLLYTAITRAKERLFIVARPGIVERMIRTVEVNLRETLLSRLLTFAAEA